MKFICSLSLLLLLTACQMIPENEYAAENNQGLILPDGEGDDFTNIDYALDGIDEEGLSHLVEDEPTDGGQAADGTDTSAVYDNIWLKLAEGFTFNVPENARIAKQRDYYLRRPQYLHQVSKRAEPFLYLIVEQIEARNLPLELALLPVVESTFDPFAYSPSNASGLWQFMPATGKRFGLKQDWWYDGRRDIYASTAAALSYMELLHKFLGQNWLHAFAAYNSGEGRVLNAVRRNQKNNKPSDYWHLSLPQETENYVPKLLALVDILRHHKKYNIELPVVPNKQVLSYVDTGAQLDLAYAAKLADLSVAEIQLLNPAFNHWATSPEGPHKLLVPTRIASQFSEQLAQSEQSSRIRWARYKVRSGDSLSVIAQKNGTTTSVLRQINDINNSFIRVGQPLLIPITSNTDQKALYAQAQRFQHAPAQSAKNKRKVQHTIVEGDTLWDISRLYKVTAKEIAQWNNMSTRQTLRLGQKLTIWKTTYTAKTMRIAGNTTYKVRSGDSLGKIAEAFKVKTADLIRWNNLEKDKYIKPGQTLTVHSRTVPAKQQAEDNITYTVRAGDSLGVIAEKFKVKTADLQRWNLLSGKGYIKPGQKLIVYGAIWDKQKTTDYTVRPGDSLSVIAELFNVKTDQLRAWNKLSRQEYIKPGQNLTVYTDNTQSSKNAVSSGTYTVRAGDSLSVIAKRFEVKTADLKRWNQLTGQGYIKPGQKLTVYSSKAQQYAQVNQASVTYQVRSGDSLGMIANKFNVKTADLVRWNKLTGQKYIKPGQLLIVYPEQYKLRG